MKEVTQTDEPSIDPLDDRRVKTNVIEDPLSAKDMNARQDKDFVYF